MTDEEYNLDTDSQEINKNSEINEDFLKNIKNNPLFNEYMKKITNCKDNKSKQKIISELENMLVTKIPETPKEKLQFKIKKLREQRRKK